MQAYSSWEQLTSAAQKKCADILQRDVATIAKEILKRHIISDIYNAYTPKHDGWVLYRGGKWQRTTYARRHVLENSLYGVLSAPDELLITSRAAPAKSIVAESKFNNSVPGAFVKLLESGNIGLWCGGFPRPAVSNAQKEIDKSSEIQKAIVAGLHREFHF